METAQLREMGSCTSVTNRAIKVTLNGTTHNRTLVNSLSDQ